MGVAESVTAHAQHHWPVPLHEDRESRLGLLTPLVDDLLEEGAVREIAHHAHSGEPVELLPKVGARRFGCHCFALHGHV